MYNGHAQTVIVIDPDVTVLPLIYCDVEPTLAQQVYLPLLAALTMPVLVYAVKFSITELVEVIVAPCGPVHIVFMVTGTSTSVSNTTTHDRFVDDPAVISE